MKFTDAFGTVEADTWNLTFILSSNIGCGAVLYSQSGSYSSTSAGELSVYLQPITIAAANWNQALWMCVYRNGSLEDSTPLARVPMSFYSEWVNASGVVNNSDLNLSRRNITAGNARFDRTYVSTYLRSTGNAIMDALDADYLTVLGSGSAVAGVNSIGVLNTPAYAASVNGIHQGEVLNFFSQGNGLTCGHRWYLDDLLSGDMWFQSTCGPTPITHLYLPRDRNQTTLNGNETVQSGLDPGTTIYGETALVGGPFLWNEHDTGSFNAYFETPNCQLTGNGAMIRIRGAQDDISFCTNNFNGYTNFGQAGTDKAGLNLELLAATNTTPLKFSHAGSPEYGYQWQVDNVNTGDLLFQSLRGSLAPSNLTYYRRDSDAMMVFPGRSVPNATLTVGSGGEVRAKNVTLEADAGQKFFSFLGTLANNTNATIVPCNLTFNMTHALKIRVNNQDMYVPVTRQPLSTDCG